MSIIHLTGKAKRYLRSLGHNLEPVVRLGKEGASEGLLAAVRTALNDHELIKVRVLAECPLEPEEAGNLLSTNTDSGLAQVLGRTLLLYRPHPEEPKIVLPRKG